MRNRVRIVVFCLLALPLSAMLVKGQGTSGPATVKTASVVAARKTFESALAKNREEFASAAAAASKKYEVAIEQGMRAATKAGNLDEANALKAELEDLSGRDFLKETSPPVGTWNLRWSEAAFTKYHFLPDGRVTRELPKSNVGTLSRTGSNLIVDFGDQGIARVNLDGERMVVEWWGKRQDFPDRYPTQFGVGNKIVSK